MSLMRFFIFKFEDIKNTVESWLVNRVTSVDRHFSLATGSPFEVNCVAEHWVFVRSVRSPFRMGWVIDCGELG